MKKRSCACSCDFHFQLTFDRIPRLTANFMPKTTNKIHPPVPGSVYFRPPWNCSTISACDQGKSQPGFSHLGILSAQAHGKRKNTIMFEIRYFFLEIALSPSCSTQPQEKRTGVNG